jgi:hypothetical protein
MMSSNSPRLSRAHVRLLASLACVLVLACVEQAPAAFGSVSGASGVGTGAPQSGQSGANGSKPNASATLEQCVTAVSQSERSATFSGEMTAVAGSTRMEMRIDVLERMPSEELFHAVSAPGLGVWRTAAPGVKVYKYLKQVTNLSSPAFYRAAVRFRWLNAKGRVIKWRELRTPRCEQPEVPPAVGLTPGTTSPSTSG